MKFLVLLLLTLSCSSSFAYIKPGEVITSKIEDQAVTTAKIQDGAVTQAKRASLGQQISSTSGSFSLSGGPDGQTADVDNLSVSITTTGRPVMFGLIGASTLTCSIGIADAGATGSAALIFVRGSTEVGKHIISLSESGATNIGLIIPCGITVIDTPTAGTYTYKVQAERTTADTFSITNARIFAFEL